MEDYYEVYGSAHPDFFAPDFQINHLDVIAHWLVYGVPSAQDVRKLDVKTWEALYEKYPKLSDFIDMSGNTIGVHGFMDGRFYISHVAEEGYGEKNIEPYTWYDDFEEALGKTKSKSL